MAASCAAQPDGPEVAAIVEQKSLSPDQLDAPEINSGIYCFETEALFSKLDSLSTNNAHGEFYLTDVAAMLVADGKRVVALKADSVDEVLGANTIAEMMHLDAAIRLATAQRLMAAGRHHLPPRDLRHRRRGHRRPRHRHRALRPAPRRNEIGSDCRIRSYSVIQNSHPRRQRHSSATAASSTAQTSATAPSSAPTRTSAPRATSAKTPTSATSSKPRKTTLGRGSKANHLTYLGDAVIGAGVNIGAGVITCNYDGVHKHTTTIGDGAFVGSDSTLVAPITIGDGAYIAAGSCITEHVPDGALALGRARQVTKSGWVAQKKSAQNKGPNKSC